MVPLAGVDGCRNGWIVVNDERAAVHATFADMLAALPEDTVIAVDMPIGLADEQRPGGREADRAARTELGPKRSSVFSAPSRSVLGARSLPEARRRGGRLTLQTLNLLPRIEDVDRVMTPALQDRVFEVHPELSFAAMDGGRPVLAPKRTADGAKQRLTRLARAGVPVPERPAGAAVDDLLDACALAWSAGRIARGEAHRVPGAVAFDRRGLRMEVRW